MTRAQWFIFSIICLLLLINNWSIPLWDQDEGAYAGFGYTMNTTGNWLVPDFMYSDVHRKPPLHFWNIALSNKLFGYNEFAVRFPSFLAILGTFLLVIFQAKKIVTQNIAFKAVVVLSGSFLVTAISKVSVTDATVLFTSTLAAFGIINTLIMPNWKWISLFWIGFALGILTKGPPIIIFSATFILILFVMHPKRKNLLQLHPWFFLPIALAPAFIWGYLTYLNDGGVFLSWMYDWYVLKRIDGDVFGQTGPFGMHMALMMVFFISFFMYIPFALFSHIKGFFRKNETSIIFFGWFLSGWLLYEFSPSKLPAYVITAHVPFALMIATCIDKGLDFSKIFVKITTVIHFCIIIAMSLLIIIVPFYMNLPQSPLIALCILGVVLLSVSIVTIFQIKKPQFGNYQLAAAFLFVFTAWTVAPQVTQITNSSKRVADYMISLPNPQNVYIGYNFGTQPSLPYYLMIQNHIVTDATFYTNDELYEHFINASKQTTFILSEEQYSYFNNQQDFDIPYYHISSLIIDRKGMADYFIINKI